MSELGIDKVKNVSKHLIDLVKEGIKAYQDDQKISTGEWLGMVDEFIPLLTDLAGAKQILAQIKDMDTQEGKELVEYILSLGVVNDKVSKIAELIVGYIEYQITGYELYLKPLIEEFKKE